MFQPTKDQFRVVLSERLRCAKQTQRNHLKKLSRNKKGDSQENDSIETVRIWDDLNRDLALTLDPTLTRRTAISNWIQI